MVNMWHMEKLSSDRGWAENIIIVAFSDTTRWYAAGWYILWL